MKLLLLDIEKFVGQGKAKPVTSSRIYSGGGRDTIDENGLFSESIFGRFGSPQRKKQFGYIDLRCKVIHPEAYLILTSLNTDLTKLLTEKEKYVFQDGRLIIDKENGETGVHFFVKIYDKLNFTILAPDKKNELDFIARNKSMLLINKYVVLPAGIRDLQVNKKSNTTTIVYADITTLYEKLLRQSQILIGDVESLPEDIVSGATRSIQRTLIEINTWIKDKMKGKQGLIRSGMLKKVTDYSGRLVITPDSSLGLGWVGLPWQIVLKLFEPFTINQLLYKDKTAIGLIQLYMDTTEQLDINDIKRFIKKANDMPDSLDSQLKNYLITVAQDIVREKVILYKRDPVLNKDGWAAMYVRVDSEGFTLKINPFDCNKHGGDFDGDACSVFCLLTNSAIAQAKQNMSPINSKSLWYSVSGANKVAYQLTNDAAMAIFSITKD